MLPGGAGDQIFRITPTVLTPAQPQGIHGCAWMTPIEGVDHEGRR
jgi:hypothetical protein